MAIAKKTSTTKAAGKASKPSVTSAGDSVTMEPITVVRTFLDGGERNEDSSETLEHVAFPANAKIGKVAVMLGTSEDFGRIKASVTVSVPGFIDELDAAAEFAVNKAKEVLDAIAEDAGEPEEEEEAPAKTTGKGKREVTSSAKPGKASTKKAPEPEEEEEEEDGTEDVELFTEDELSEMDEDQLKELCEQWEVAWPKAKKASVAKAQAIASILEKQEEFAEEAGDGEDGEAEGDEDEDGVGPEDLEAMDRKQLEAFIKEYNDDAEEDEQLEVDLGDYPKNSKGLANLKKDLIEALFGEE